MRKILVDTEKKKFFTIIYINKQVAHDDDLYSLVLVSKVHATCVHKQ